MARGRPRKSHLARMGAAVDAMVAFGFPVAKIKKHVKLLLEVYGGDDGWPFIEEYSYRELLEAMLRDVEDEQDKKALTDGSDVGTSTRDEGPRYNSSPANTVVMPSGASTQPKSSETNKALSRTDQIISGMSTLPPANSLPPNGPHRRPSYGWIESDDDEGGFVYLKPLLGRFGVKGEAVMPPNDRTRSREKRRAKWDLKPKDP